jgi:Tfp pilus assembly protein PilO
MGIAEILGIIIAVLSIMSIIGGWIIYFVKQNESIKNIKGQVEELSKRELDKRLSQVETQISNLKNLEREVQDIKVSLGKIETLLNVIVKDRDHEEK